MLIVDSRARLELSVFKRIDFGFLRVFVFVLLSPRPPSFRNCYSRWISKVNEWIVKTRIERRRGGGGGGKPRTYGRKKLSNIHGTAARSHSTLSPCLVSGDSRSPEWKLASLSTATFGCNCKEFINKKLRSRSPQKSAVRCKSVDLSFRILGAKATQTARRKEQTRDRSDCY